MGSSLPIHLPLNELTSVSVTRRVAWFLSNTLERFFKGGWPKRLGSKTIQDRKKSSKKSQQHFTCKFDPPEIGHRIIQPFENVSHIKNGYFPASWRLVYWRLLGGLPQLVSG